MELKRIKSDIRFFSRLAVSEIKNYLKRRHPASPCKMGEKIVILGNGPSQKLYWDNRDKFSDYDLLCVNHFPVRHEQLFFEAKPKYICLCDPAFFGMQLDWSNSEYEKTMVQVRALWSLLEKVDWECYIIFPNVFRPLKDLLNIRKIKLTSLISEYYEHLYKLFLKNIVKPDIMGVAGESIYFAITFGYKNIALFGFDSNFLWMMRVNENNEIIVTNTHTYGNVTGKLNDRVAQKVYLHEEILSQYKYFKGFYDLSLLANKRQISIVNYCINSYIDVFEKRQLDS